MGLDIHLGTNNPDLWLEDGHDYFFENSLSRTFCNLMCRRDVVFDEEPELDQIGTITGIDISILYEMNNYPNVDAMDYFLSSANNEQERQDILKKAAADKAKLDKNIDEVSAFIDILIEKVSKIDNLPSLFAPTAFETINREVYFSDFEKDTGDDYIGNNFGQDLRNFKAFLIFAKSKGATGVHFNYG
ncbi:hypothetical protein KXQ82_00960 [Mucilaginibacter sp. HMF5004]|uniref:hypothetical protein n=1 Tax=Mucilaginibacter rivuli TaxID=2857527 RepID=UPI001C605302|nr:hypothetical protein [Mucilaginibacter rivuli]MBW4888258.1 hypothetical protein [Mucilaginibacter rivuli]